MRKWPSLAPVKWECKYHVVIVPKYRRKIVFERVRKRVGKVFQQLCRQKDIGLVEGHMMLDHVHMVLSIPPK
jgi:putative transposase